MNEKTDAPQPDASSGVEQLSATRKPRLALLIATACGLGYLPKAPGTFGALAGLLLLAIPFWLPAEASLMAGGVWSIEILLAALTAAMGVWSSYGAAAFWQQKDPQRVVIDEVSGQHLTFLLLLGGTLARGSSGNAGRLLRLGTIALPSGLSWKYLLVGFILFRVFDIWKPFPVRQAESLPGGWGIMADDWVAGIYAGIGLSIARALGL